jgi:GH15 family glucan-1,4-alpha-glucosidase
VYKKIEQYGLIGNLETCALVGDDGSIDWLCTPELDSPSVFAAILDHEKGGRFSINPVGPYFSTQTYIHRTNVLETSFWSESGSIVLTDFMTPVYELTELTGKPRSLFRKVECSDGELEIDVRCTPRFDYARILPRIERLNNGIVATGGSQRIFLHTTTDFHVGNNEIYTNIKLTKGDRIWFTLSYDDEHAFTPRQCEIFLEKTIHYWQGWAHDCDIDTCVFKGPWHDQVVRSGLVLKLLTHPETGAIAAAPTTSLPEDLGGVRNWDYRYAWIRDSSFTAQALYDLGHKDEALEYFHWFHRICQKKKHPSEIQIMYGLHGNLDLTEEVLPHLNGYMDSRPVRIGNGAAKQKQLDIYGELIEAFFETFRYERGIPDQAWKLIGEITNYVCEVWDTPDYGIWEVRSEPKHFTHSKLMCWVTLDRSLRMAKYGGFKAPVKKWKKVRDEIAQTILERGYNKKIESFVQDFDSEYLDATALLIPLMEFLPVNDPRVQNTVAAINKHLSHNGLIYRYNGEDGLPGGEGTFLLCTFWMVDVLALSGRIDEAEELYGKVLGYMSPLGLFAEEYDVVNRLHLGNYPQGFSHIGLINSALYLGKARGLQQIGPEPLGMELQEMPDV